MEIRFVDHYFELDSHSLLRNPDCYSNDGFRLINVKLKHR